MDAILIRSRYKVTFVPYACEGYAAMQAVDVESRDKREYLLNVYEDQWVRPYVAAYASLQHYSGFHGVFMDEGSLVAVFDAVGGTPIDQVFFRGAQLPWQTRLAFAQELFHLGLTLADQPPELACASLLSENLRLWPKEGRLAVSAQLRPMENMNQREAAFLVIDQVKKVLLRRFSSPKEEINFLDSLEEQTFPTPVALYAHWTQAAGKLREDYEQLYAKPALQRWLYLAFQNALRFVKRRWKRKGSKHS